MRTALSALLFGLLSTAFATPLNLPREDTVHLVMHTTSGTVYPLDVPLNNKIVTLKAAPVISTIDKWTNFDNVWCGFGGATTPKISYGADDVTHFEPAFALGEVKCCVGVNGAQC